MPLYEFPVLSGFFPIHMNTELYDPTDDKTDPPIPEEVIKGRMVAICKNDVPLFFYLITEGTRYRAEWADGKNEPSDNWSFVGEVLLENGEFHDWWEEDSFEHRMAGLTVTFLISEDEECKAKAAGGRMILLE